MERRDGLVECCVEVRVEGRESRSYRVQQMITIDQRRDS